MSEIYFQARTEDGKSQRWVLDDDHFMVGRGDGTKSQNRLSVSGDPMLSRQHFQLQRRDNSVIVKRHPKARNPLFFKGKQQDEFELKSGQAFVTGKTRFGLYLARTPSQEPITEYTMLRTQLQEVQQENSAASFHTLLSLLPKLRGANSDTALQRTLEVLSALLPQAAELKVLRQGDPPEPVIEWCKVAGIPATPASRRLVSSALTQQATVAHVWALESESELQATAHAQADWAVASPVNISVDEKYCLYAVGSSAVALTDTQVRDQKKNLDELAALLDIVAETLGHHLTTERMNRFEGQVGQFFSPGLRERLSDKEFSQVLEPRLRDVTVMFFDLRGFSKATESAEEENLDKILSHHEVLTRVMTEVTEAVFRQGGLVIDYQGDAVLACWGALSEKAEVTNAAEAAIDICRVIRQLEVPFGGQPLACGIGMAKGRAVAGQIGAKEQIKFGVLGKVVNLASRLEGLTKPFGVPILVNQAFRDELAATQTCRYVGRVKPAGLTQEHDIHELVVSQEFGGSGLSPQQADEFDKITQRLVEGHLDAAKDSLSNGTQDPVSTFLLEEIERLKSRGDCSNWDGVIEFSKK
jgi:adenylate cyclase